MAQCSQAPLVADAGRRAGEQEDVGGLHLLGARPGAAPRRGRRARRQAARQDDRGGPGRHQVLLPLRLYAEGGLWLRLL